jgi:hypothetical protein
VLASLAIRRAEKWVFGEFEGTNTPENQVLKSIEVVSKLQAARFQESMCVANKRKRKPT